MFTPPERQNLPTPVITSMEVHGFRGIRELRLAFDSPLVAIGGPNGSGKSTVLQLLACSYQDPSKPTPWSEMVNSYFPVYDGVSQIDSDAKVVYTYEGTGSITRKAGTAINISQSKNIAWMPTRSTFHMELLAPELRSRRSLPEVVQEEAGRILARDVPHDLGLPESGLGLGEGRLVHLVDRLETDAEGSLFVLEEPDATLHPRAQSELARYLSDVCLRRRHQIFLSTNSDILMTGLPSVCRLFLFRMDGKVEAVGGISIKQASCLLDLDNRDGSQPSLLILVEDEVAKAVLTEMIRVSEPQLLGFMSIVASGDKNALVQQQRILAHYGRKAVAVRDADVGESPADGLYSLPGSLPPEKELIGCPQVLSYIRSTYGLDALELLDYWPELDHHDYFDVIAECASVPAGFLVMESARQYARSLSRAEREPLVARLRAHIELEVPKRVRRTC